MAAMNITNVIKDIMVIKIYMMYTNTLLHFMRHFVMKAVNLAGSQWLEQYLGEFYFTIEEIESSPCHQFFKFGPSKRYLSTSMVKIPVIVQRSNGRYDV